MKKLEVKVLTLKQIQTLLQQSDFIDAKTLLAVKYWEQLSDKEDQHEA